MKRTLAIGDIHGGFKALKQIIKRIRLNEDDTLIFLGDYVDGWSESAQVIHYLIKLSITHNCIFIKGNHDVWCEEWLRSGKTEPVWLAHGGKETIESYANYSLSQKRQHLNFFERMKLYHLDEQKRLFLHAGFTSMHGVERETFKENFYFDRTLWEMAMIADKQVDIDAVNYPNRLKHYSEIYIGHTPTINFDSQNPMNAFNVWNIDTGAAFTGKLSAIDINTKAIFQSEQVMTFYPEESGRNEISYQKRNQF